MTVPNVKPFELNAVKTLKPGSEMPGVSANDLEKQNVDGASQNEEAAEEASKKAVPPTLSLYISTKEKMLEVYSGEQLVAAFPVTVGSQHTESPIGQWTVKGIAKLPNFRYDLKMLKDGERGSTFHMLPPGPNNPVGVVWIDLSKEHYGIHGTPEPGKVGHTQSHGCIRMTNWDAMELAGMVAPKMDAILTE